MTYARWRSTVRVIKIIAFGYEYKWNLQPHGSIATLSGIGIKETNTVSLKTENTAWASSYIHNKLSKRIHRLTKLKYPLLLLPPNVTSLMRTISKVLK